MSNCGRCGFEIGPNEWTETIDGELYHRHEESCCELMFEAIPKMRAEIERLRKDAQRYRESTWFGHPDTGWTTHWDWNPDIDDPSDLDATIDAAIAAEGGGA